MKRSLSILAVFAVIFAARTGRCEDSLFSHTPINSVFAQPDASLPTGPSGPPTPTNPPANTRLSGAPALAQLVSQAGLDPKAVSENVVSTKIQHETWAFPALVTTSDDRSQVILVLLLAVLKDEQRLSADKLLDLMNANRDEAPAFFAYSSKRKRIELYRTLDNDGVTSEQLRGEISRLAEIAARTQGLWNPATPDAAKPAAPPTNSTTATQPATVKPLATAKPPVSSAPRGAASAPPALVGRWSAAKSKTEAFAMQLKVDGTFVLVHVKQGKQTRSTGRFTLSGQSLTLAGSDGSKLAGDLRSVSDKEFSFQPTGGKAGSLTFKKAS